MGYAAFDGVDRQSRLLGTGVSIAAHGALAALLLLGTVYAPAPLETSGVPVTSLKLDFLYASGAGQVGGRGSGTAPEPARKPETSRAPEFAPIPKPVEATPVEVTIPVVAVDGTTVLPGSAINLDPTTLARGMGAGAGNGRGAGPGAEDGPGAGPGRDGLGAGFEVGGGVTAPQLVREVKPVYTVSAMRAKVQGRVELDVVVLPDGSVDPRRIHVVHSLDTVFGLDGQAIEAVKQWQFRPGTHRNQPVPVRVRVELTFTLR